MNVNVAPGKERRAATPAKQAIADCDLHPTPNTLKELYPYLEPRWHQHLEMFGTLRRHGYQHGPAYPKGQPDAARRDAWPEAGRPGSRLDFMQRQHLDPNNVQLGVLTTIAPHPGGYQNAEMSAVFCRAINDWQVDQWTSKDGRLKGSIMLPYEHGAGAVEEIERRAGDPNFVQVFFLSRTAEPLGQRRYWPIYEAAQAANLPVGIHAFGFGGYPITAGGWPSFYIEEMAGHSQCCQSQVTSMVLEGVFERFPKLRVVILEGGFAWLPPLAWRLDKVWNKLRAETPHLKRLPSEYIRDHIWLTTQPMEEPENSQHLHDVMEWIGWDKLLFATDYPHWDYDDPARALPIRLSEERSRDFFLNNALKLYGLT
jgi:predicted TIM-barrel fold metal-dependent hydrolase